MKYILVVNEQMTLLESLIVRIEKKCGAQDCVDFRTISFVSHASKIVLTEDINSQTRIHCTSQSMTLHWFLACENPLQSHTLGRISIVFGKVVA